MDSFPSTTFNFVILSFSLQSILLNEIELENGNPESGSEEQIKECQSQKFDCRCLQENKVEPSVSSQTR